MTGPKSEKVTIDTNSSILSNYAPVISIRGPITSETAESFRSAVETLLFERPTEIGLIELNSPGGDLLPTLEILNIMKGSKIQWATYCASYAMSAAAVILSAGEPGRRFMSPLSTVMVHELSGSPGWGHISEIKASTKWLDQLNGMVVDVFCSNCGISRAEFTKRMKANDGNDLYMTPHEAKKFGMIDEVAIMSLAQSQAYQIEVVHEEGEKVNFESILNGIKEQVAKKAKEDRKRPPRNK